MSDQLTALTAGQLDAVIEALLEGRDRLAARGEEFWPAAEYLDLRAWRVLAELKEKMANNPADTVASFEELLRKYT